MAFRYPWLKIIFYRNTFLSQYCASKCLVWIRPKCFFCLFVCPFMLFNAFVSDSKIERVCVCVWVCMSVYYSCECVFVREIERVCLCVCFCLFAHVCRILSVCVYMCVCVHVCFIICTLKYVSVRFWVSFSPFVSVWEFTKLLTQILNIFLNFKVLLQSSYW